MMEASCAYETSFNFYQTTWRYKPEHCLLLVLGFFPKTKNITM
jgi:hypothetical protein